MKQRQPEGKHVSLPRPEGLIYYAQGAAVAGVATTRRGDHGGVVGCEMRWLDGLIRWACWVDGLFGVSLCV